MNHTIRCIIAAVAIVPLSALVSGCNTTKPPVKADTTVKTDTPKEKRLKRVIEQPASIDPFQETPLVAHIAGYVKKVNVDIGVEVKVDDVLAELAVPELVKEHAQKQALVEQAKAEIDQAKAHAGETEAAIGRAEAQRERWESEYVRVEKLFKEKIVEKQIVDETLAQLKSARAVKAEAVARHTKSKADIAAAVAREKVAKADEGRVKAMADYRHIQAPFNGIVTRRNVHPGHYLQPNASGGPAVLFIVAQSDKLRIVADLPEGEAQYMADNRDAVIDVPTLKDQTFTGKIARTSKTLDTKTRTLRVEIDYDNKEGKLRPGMYANLIFTIDLGDRWTLPASAIFMHSDLPCCWRVDAEGKAVRTPLKLGVRDGQDVEVLKMQKAGAWEAVNRSDTIVVSNLGAVSEGKEVRRK
ncbi:MAG: efflux RND transporter periplasmic adaptor subunit [Planctomycetes bacterium]|nr:efflux RND transporter periplasmic adaptor subunit [Planctomycetota bacterium]